MLYVLTHVTTFDCDDATVRSLQIRYNHIELGKFSHNLLVYRTRHVSQAEVFFVIYDSKRL